MDESMSPASFSGKWQTDDSGTRWTRWGICFFSKDGEHAHTYITMFARKRSQPVMAYVANRRSPWTHEEIKEPTGCGPVRHPPMSLPRLHSHPHPLKQLAATVNLHMNVTDSLICAHCRLLCAKARTGDSFTMHQSVLLSQSGWQRSVEKAKHYLLKSSSCLDHNTRHSLHWLKPGAVSRDGSSP